MTLPETLGPFTVVNLREWWHEDRWFHGAALVLTLRDEDGDLWYICRRVSALQISLAHVDVIDLMRRHMYRTAENHV